MLTLFLSPFSGNAQVSRGDIEYVSSQLYPATTLLYSQTDDGNMKMRCTATAIEKTAKGYRFITAAHCACEDDVEAKTVSPEKAFFYLTTDDTAKKEFLKAEIVGCGYRHAGDDFAMFQVETDKVFPVIPLGDDPKTLESVVNVASPLGLGKQTFMGSISSATLERAVIVDDINWTHTVLMQLFGTDGGSSGSSVVCLEQKKICALVVGSINRTSIVAIPVSRLVKFKVKLAAGTYKQWVEDPDKPQGKKGADTKSRGTVWQ